MRPYIHKLKDEELNERLGYLNYVIPKIITNIERLEDDILNAKEQLKDYEIERKELINGS